MTTATWALRSDLHFSRQGSDEAPYFVVKDSQRNQFYRFNEIEHFIIQCLNSQKSLESICIDVEQKFDEQLEIEELQSFIQQLWQSNLLNTDEPSQSVKERRIKGSVLYLRFKLFDPNRLFDYLIKHVQFFFTSTFVFSAVTLAVLAMGILISNFDALTHEVISLVSFKTLFAVWLTIIATTILHEFAHGLTCKRFGGEVHEIGFMLIFFQPAMYCNISDAWLFPEKSKRLWTTFAGGFFELFLWSLAVITWRVVQPDTLLHFISMLIIATSSVRMLFNFNPLIKLDGYYLLSDWLDVHNLRDKAIQYIKYKFKRLLGDKKEIKTFSMKERRIYFYYGIGAVCFITFFLTFIISKFGSFLIGHLQGTGFLLISLFVFLVFKNQILRMIPSFSNKQKHNSSAHVEPTNHDSTLDKELSMEDNNKSNKKMKFPKFPIKTSLLAIFITSSFFIHLELTVSGESNVIPIDNTDIHAPVEGIIEDVFVEEGQTVQEGELLARLSDRHYRSELQQVQAEMSVKQAERALLIEGPSQEQIQLLNEKISKEHTRYNYAKSEVDRLQELVKTGVIARNEYENKEEELAIAEKDLSHAKAELSALHAKTRPEEISALDAELERLSAKKNYLDENLKLTDITSPIAGIVTTEHTEKLIGTFVESGDLIMDVHQFDTVIVKILVPEKEIAEIDVDQDVVFKARAYPEKNFRGKVTSISPTAKQIDTRATARVVVINTEIDNSDLLLKPEMSGYGKIYCGERKLIDLITRRLYRYIRVEFWSWW